MNTDNTDYKAAYQRQKLAREKAENLLENRSRELYDSKLSLEQAYEKLKSQKSQLLHQEKLASIGQLSAGIAHEINNPAGFVKSNLTTLKAYTEQLVDILSAYKSAINTDTDKLSSALDAIKALEDEYDSEYILEDLPTLIADSIDGTVRITEIVNGLKNFSRIDSDSKEVLDVNACIDNTIKLVQNEIKYKADLNVSLGELPFTMGYPGSLSQVFLNLLVNASHAIEGFGEISIVSSVEPFLSKGDFIIIRINDNGCGMDAETMKKIFDPFYTTKEVGVGTGLGLSISMGIIEQHNGYLDVSSEQGKGTCFTIALPILDSGG